MTTAQENLMALGFTALEADVYTSLLASPSMTGYRIAQVLGKPVANVYKAIESLRGKGAVIVDNSGNKFYRGVPPAELLAALERRMVHQIEQAEATLSRITPAATDERTYELLTREQVVNRARTMLRNVQEVVLLDLFPEPVQILKDDIVAAAQRDVTVAVMVYEPTTLPGVTVFVNPKGPSIRKRWPGDWLNLVADAKEHLLSFLSNDEEEVLQAVWSASPYLAWIYQSSLSGEMMATALLLAIEDKRPRKDLLAVIRQFEKIKALQAPGYKELLQKFVKRNSPAKRASVRRIV